MPVKKGLKAEGSGKGKFLYNSETMPLRVKKEKRAMEKLGLRLDWLGFEHGAQLLILLLSLESEG